MSLTATAPPPPGDPSRRLLWIVNHKTLMLAEVPILRTLGWEVFVPKVVPDHDPGFRSAAITWEYDASLELPPTALAVLNRHNFYEHDWSATVAEIVNTYFDVLVTHFSYYTTPLSEAARKFRGAILARAFGREHPRRYTEFANMAARPRVLAELAAVGERFIFGQGYDNIAEVEDPPLPRRAHTIAVPLPDSFYGHRNTWAGGAAKAIFLCPSVAPGSYYGEVYEGIKRDFGDLPHLIFGRQTALINDPAVMPYLTDDELWALYRSAPVFIYPSDEPRHIHYSPLEAIIVGTPVLYRRGALTDVIAGEPLPGACTDTAEMHDKARRLLGGDRDLADAIRASQGRILDAFAPDLARRQWAAALAAAPVSRNAA